MLETDANTSDSECISLATYEQRTTTERMIREMQLDDLGYLENDLEFYQKVPLMFLLGAHSTTSTQQVLQSLTISYQAMGHPTSFLLDWARHTPDWAPILVEALTIIRAHFVLLRLGLDLTALREKFLPHRPDVCDRIHPIVKWLNYICEELSPPDTRLLIAEMSKKFPDQRYQLRNIPTPTERYLEMWLLLWLSEGLIEVGDWERNVQALNRPIHCNMEPILDAMKSSGSARLFSIHGSFQRAKNCFNCTSRYVLTKDPKQVGFEKDRQLGDGEAASLDANSGPTKCSANVEHQQRLPIPEDIGRYRLRPNSMGYALIINQVHFKTTDQSHPTKRPLEKRLGSNSDKAKLIETFSNLGYLCLGHNNLTAAETEAEIKKVAIRCQNMDSMVLCFLSHGFEGHVYASDTVAMKISHLEQLLAVPSLMRKPKLIIIQACQGEETTTDAGKLESDGPNDPLPCMLAMRSDVCLAMSTIPGFESYRNTVTGSWFVQLLCKVINDHHTSHHFTDILTMVCNEISDQRGEKQESMVSRFISSLRRPLFLTPSPIAGTQEN